MNMQVIKGTLLGDAWIQKKLPNSFSFNFEQAEFDYSLWKAKMSGCKFSLTKRKRFDKRSDRTYYVYSVHLTIDKTVKSKLHKSFYFPKKEVTKEVLNGLSPLAIAIWFMDDGCLYYNGNNCHTSLSTGGFSDESVSNIVQYFKINYDLNFKRVGKDKLNIRLTSVRDAKIFMNLIEKYIPKCMKRKTLRYAIRKHKAR